MSDFDIFSAYKDDYMFPTTPQGMRAVGMVMESASKGTADKEPQLSRKDMVLETVANYDTRANAMSAVLGWIEEGNFTYDDLDAFVYAFLDLDDDDEPTEDDDKLYSDVWEVIPEALISLGADPKDVDTLYDGPGPEADKAAARIGATVKDVLNEEPADYEDILTDFAVGDEVLESASWNRTARDNEAGILEAIYKKKLVFSHGKKEFRMKHMGGKVKRTAAQKISFKKDVQKYAHSAKANHNRDLSMRKRRQAGK